MRPPRIAILALFFAACVFLLCRAVVATAQPTVPAAPSSRSNAETSPFRSLFSFSAPFTLFPPNAIITIADDNSTSFAARPAAFGPPLPTKGLVGELWVGSGFTEETFQDGEGEGELGCSDVPGWDGNAYSNAVLKPSTKDPATDKSKSAATTLSQTKVQKRSFSKRFAGTSRTMPVYEPRSKGHPVNDGTDDYLHQRLSRSSTSHRDGFGLSGSAHADIQSIQEGAEIAHKIVLLSRGGCGFLEKVKWAQRRGAIGVIVGDNQRGGPLIQMFAHGDTSNVTIPSIFTSRTTAYLLSLMMQPGSFIEDIVDENGKPTMNVQQQSEKSRKAKKARQSSLPSTLVSRGVAGSKSPRSLSTSTLTEARRTGTDPANSGNTSPRWFSRLFNWGSKSVSVTDRTSATGKVDWVLVEDFSDEKDKIIKNSLKKAAKGNADKSKPPADNFQIGVEDWRDPDLVGPVDDEEDEGSNRATDRSRLQSKSSKATSGDRSDGKMKSGTSNFKGSSKTSGTGEYTADGVPAKDRDVFDSAKGKSTTTTDNGGLLSKLFGSSEEEGDEEASNTASQPKPINTPIARPLPGEDPPTHDPHDEEGLRVVITPSSGASPFFDTLLVLVISPLITLTVVYALLILRARIRRRRWRAPKSVVDRLPVRTYHTVATSSQSSRIPSPTSSSPTTPLLQGQRSSQGSRPRSRTTTGVPSTGGHLQVDTTLTPSRAPSQGSPPRAEHEKRGSEWKKYMGRQVECAVCLEEYVDGVSQVMSLPCGHEFHVDCM